jgi:hypothetical protein
MMSVCTYWKGLGGSWIGGKGSVMIAANVSFVLYASNERSKCQTHFRRLRALFYMSETLRIGTRDCRVGPAARHSWLALHSAIGMHLSALSCLALPCPALIVWCWAIREPLLPLLTMSSTRTIWPSTSGRAFVCYDMWLAVVNVVNAMKNGQLAGNRQRRASI